MGVDARIQVYDKMLAELKAEGMSDAQARRELAVKHADVNRNYVAAFNEQAQARMNGGAVGRYDGGRATVSPHMSGGGAGAPPAASASGSGEWAGGDPVAAFDEAVAKAVTGGASKKEAIRGVVVGEKALHRAYLQAYNARVAAG